jgi:hypothetical protein
MEIRVPQAASMTPGLSWKGGAPRGCCRQPAGRCRAAGQRPPADASRLRLGGEFATATRLSVSPGGARC